MENPYSPQAESETTISSAWWRRIVILEWLAAFALAGSALAVLFKIYAS